MRSVDDIPGRIQVIREHAKTGGRVAAVFPIHYPRALLRAFNILPVEVWGPPAADVHLGDAHLQSYICSIVRCGLHFLMKGGLRIVDLIVVPHACDSLQGFASLLLDFLPAEKPVIPLYLPRGRRGSDVSFLRSELQAVAEKLSAITGSQPTSDDLRAAIEREVEADATLAELHARRMALPLSNERFYRVVRAREYLPSERFTTMAKAVLQRAGSGRVAGIPIVLSGIVPEPAEFLSALTDIDVVVAADDFAACGRRLYPPGLDDDPFRRMAERIVNGPPDVMRGSPISERLSHLERLVTRSGARGVIFYSVKFCEPEQFDVPDLRKGLEAKGIRSVAVEVDLTEQLPYQIVTRLEAFVEMIA